MSKFCAVHRPPRAGVDRIDGPAAALAVIRLAMRRPLTAETIALVLDDDHRGRTVVVVDGTVEADALLDVVEHLCASLTASAPPAALVLATVRPDLAPVPGDADRWRAATTIAEEAGVELLEWFVVSTDAGRATAWCPRELLAEPPRWPP